MKNKYKILSFLSILLLSKNLVFAQTSILIKGRIVDTLSSKSIEGGSVFLYNKDTLITSELIRDDGVFNLTLKKSITSLVLILRNLDYENKAIRINLSNKDIDLGDIRLKQSVKTLKEVNIIANRQPIILKNNRDTLEADFSNQYFRKYIMTDQALELIPGVSLLDSKLYFNGEEIQNIKVDGRTFLFDNDFLLYNLPGLSIKKVQIISDSDDLGKKNRRLNIVLKDNNKRAYIFDFTSAKGTRSSNWGSLIASKTDSLFQVGIRAQSNNLNQFSGLWDIRTTNKINNIYGINRTENLELTGLYQFNKRTRLDFNYLVDNQISVDERTNTLIDLTSLDQNQSELNSSSKFTKKSHFLTLAIDHKLNSLTDFSVKTNGEMFTNISKNRSNYYFKNGNESDSTFYGDNRRFKANRLELAFRLNRLNKKNKTSFYSLELAGEFDKGQYYSDSLNEINNNNTISSTRNLRIQADNKVNFIIDSNSTLHGFLINDFKSFYNGGNKLNGAATVDTYYNTLGVRYYRTGKSSMFINLSALDYSLKHNRYTVYKTFGIISNVNFDFTINSKNKISVSVNNTRTLPSIIQITGLETSGLPQLLPILPNYELRPETVFNLNSTYNYKDLINLDLGGALSLNKIENIVAYSNAPYIHFFNSKKTESFYFSARLDKNFFEEKLSLGNTFKVNYNLSTFYTDKEFIPNSMVFLSYYLSLKYSLKRFLRINYLMEISKSEFLKGQTSKILTYSSTLNMSCDVNNTFSLLCDARIVESNGFLQKKNISKIINLNISRKVLKNRNLTLFCEANNVFNDIVGQIIYSDSNKLQRTNINGMGRYFLFGAKYKLNTYKQ